MLSQLYSDTKLKVYLDGFFKNSMRQLNSGVCSIRVYLLMAAELYFSILSLALAFPGNFEESTRFLLIPYAKKPTSGSVKDTIL